MFVLRFVKRCLNSWKVSCLSDCPLLRSLLLSFGAAPRSFVRNKIKRTQTVSYLFTNFPLYFWCLKMRCNFNWLTLIKGKKQKIWNETTKPTRESGKLVLFCRKLYVLVALNIFMSRKLFKSLWTPTLLSLSMKTARARLQRTGISLNFVKTLIG